MKFFASLRQSLKKLSSKKSAPAVKRRDKDEITATRYVAAGLSPSKVKELFEVVQLRDVMTQLPADFAGGKILQLLFMGAPLSHECREKGAGTILTGYIGRAEAATTKLEQEFAFRTAADRLPLRDWSCRWALSLAPQAPAVAVGGLIRELGRVVEPGGGAVFVDWHPYSVAVVRALAGRPVVDEKEGIGFEKYFRAFQKGGFQVTGVRESFVDGSVRKMMEKPEEKQWYEKYRKTPLAMTLSLKKAR